MGKLKSRFLSMPLKRAFTLLVLAMALLVAGLSALVISGCMSIQQQLLDQVKVPLTSIVDPDLGNSETEDEVTDSQQMIIADDGQIEADENGDLIVVTLEHRMENMSAQDRICYYTASVAEILLPCLFFVIGACLCAWGFYSIKLKKPLGLLLNAAERISKNELDFAMEYESVDEMGTLIRAMDTMRSELSKSHREMWDMMEERRKLNASIAHDLRTPLTVMKGYTEYLTRNLPTGRVSESKLMETVGNLSQAAERMESYVNQVRDLQALDAVPVERKPACLSDVFGQLKTAYTSLAAGQDIRFEMGEAPSLTLLLDEKLLSRILDNAVSNALRFAKNKISMETAWQDGLLTVTVKDDGPGFSEKALESAAKPFYKENSQNDHYGLGLSICDTLCRKLGGKLTLKNNDEGGACVEIRIRAEMERQSTK